MQSGGRFGLQQACAERVLAENGSSPSAEATGMNVEKLAEDQEDEAAAVGCERSVREVPRLSTAALRPAGNIN